MSSFANWTGSTSCKTRFLRSELDRVQLQVDPVKFAKMTFWRELTQIVKTASYARWTGSNSQKKEYYARRTRGRATEVLRYINRFRFDKTMESVEFEGGANGIPILEDIFTYGPDQRELAVQLFANRIQLSYSRSNHEQNIYLSDVIGTQCEAPYKQGDTACSLIINSFPYLSSTRSTQNQKYIQRKKAHFKLDYSKRGNSIEQNNSIVNNWHVAIRNFQNKLVDRSHVLTSPDGITQLKPFLVFVNPHSGTGKAVKILLRNVFNIWNEAGISNHIVFTGILFIYFSI
jgi:hypothetical protein